MNKLQRIKEMEKQLAALKAEVERESKKWEPKGGDWYYSPRGVINDSSKSDAFTSFGIERPSKEQAEADYKLSRAYNRLLAYKAEFDSAYIPDWSNYKWDKFYLYQQNGTWQVGSSKCASSLGVVYFSKQAASDLCHKLNSGEVVL